jgi:hypothetical protein
LTTLRVSVGLDQIKKKAANAATAAEDVPNPNSSLYARNQGIIPMKRWLNLVSILMFLLSGMTVQANQESKDSKVDHYYCTVADERHFPMLMNLVGSIHRNDYDALDQIAIFDIGLTRQQRDLLNTIEKTHVYDVEKVHPDLLSYFTTNPAGRTVRGWFAWKPVVMKQALDMFPYFLYLDAGTLVLRPPENLFKHIKQNGYYLMEINPHSIESSVTKPVIDKVINHFPPETAEFLMSSQANMIDAGFQGVSRSVKDSYIVPVYQLASDLTLFADDGSGRLGYGAGRHDQVLFSIYAQINKFNFNSQGWTNLKVDGQDTPFHIHWNRYELNDQTTIYRSRGDYLFAGDQSGFIRWSKGKTPKELPRLLIKIPCKDNLVQLSNTLDKYYQYLSDEYPYQFLLVSELGDPIMASDEIKKMLERAKKLNVTYTDSKAISAFYNEGVAALNGTFDIIIAAREDWEPSVAGFDKIIVEAMNANFPDYDGVINFYSELNVPINIQPIIGKKYYERFGYVYNPDYQTSHHDNELTHVSRILGKEVSIKQELFKPSRISPVPKREMSAADEALFKARQANMFDLNDALLKTLFPKDWSILICTLDERQAQFSLLYDKLIKQIKDNHLDDRVEVVVFKDNRENTVGFKRNTLMRQGKGMYVNYIDDDDEIHDQYVAMIHEKLKSGPDCVSLLGIITFDGQSPANFIHSIKYDHYFEVPGVYFRPPNHINTMKRSVASQFLFPNVSYGEDTDWAMRIARSRLLKKEETIHVPYYFYKYVSHKRLLQNSI